VPVDASVLDLRYKMHDVIKALDRREKVRILYHGKVKGEITPFKKRGTKKSTDQPLFGMLRDSKERPEEIVEKMRRSRSRDL
jgi:hypothetical protein